MCSLRIENRILQKTSDEHIRKYGEQKKVVERSVGKLVKSIETRFSGVGMCISRAIQSWYSQIVAYFKKYNADMAGGSAR